jgi:phosphoribosylamine--glycine ligase
VVIEEFLDGIELSCFVLTDGKTTKYYQLLKITNALARRHRIKYRRNGCGFTSSLCRCGFDGKIETRIVKPTIDGFQKDGIPYKGFVL